MSDEEAAEHPQNIPAHDVLLAELSVTSHSRSPGYQCLGRTYGLPAIRETLFLM